jgi:hypothetical protein
VAASDGKRDRPSWSVAAFVAEHPAWARLEEQLEWYDRKSSHCQRCYKGLKFFQIALAIAIPAFNLLPSDLAKWISAASGVAIALLEAVQQMNQYSRLWITYRSTAERLQREKFLFLSAAGPYRKLTPPEQLVQLAERVEELVSAEHAGWFDETQRGLSQDRHAAGREPSTTTTH